MLAGQRCLGRNPRYARPSSLGRDPLSRQPPASTNRGPQAVAAPQNRCFNYWQPGCSTRSFSKTRKKERIERNLNDCRRAKGKQNVCILRNGCSAPSVQFRKIYSQSHTNKSSNECQCPKVQCTFCAIFCNCNFLEVRRKLQVYLEYRTETNGSLGSAPDMHCKLSSNCNILEVRDLFSIF